MHWDIVHHKFQESRSEDEMITGNIPSILADSQAVCSAYTLLEETSRFLAI